MGLIKEFKDFAMRGSVIDLAVGVVIGAAFQKIVDSVVKDLLMPVLGLLLNGIDFSHLEIPLMGEAKITIGNFINTTIQFIIMAFAVFLLIKGINKLKRLQEEKDAAAEANATPAEPNAQEKLLSEIRDLLKNK
jgi:large conductance mechanosensitive channel